MPFLLTLIVLLAGCLPPAPRPITNCVPGTRVCDQGVVTECSPQGRPSPIQRCTDIRPVSYVCVQVSRMEAECQLGYSDGGVQ